MKLLLDQHGILLLWIQSVFAWMHPKCVLFDSGEGRQVFPLNIGDFGRGYTAVCERVRDIEEDLTGLPPRLNNIRISMAPGGNSSLRMVFFSQFQDLEMLKISGCITQILPTGHSQGLPNLHQLNLSGEEKSCCDGNFKSNSLSDLVTLNKLSIFDYRITAMAPDIFKPMSLLQIFSIYDTASCIHDLSEIACRVMNIKSLQELYITVMDVLVTKPVNCSVVNVNGSIPVLQNLKISTLLVSRIKLLEEGSLTWLQNLSSFRGIYQADILLRMPLSGIKRIKYLDLSIYSEEFEFECVCEIVFMLSVRSIHLNHNLIASFPTTSVSSCLELEYMSLIGPGYPVTTPINHFKLEFITSLKNLSTLYVINQGQRPDMGDLCSFQTQPIPWLRDIALKIIYLDVLVANQLSCLVNLQHLDLSTNVISNIEEFAFLGLTKLESLSLTKNKITQIHKNTFFGLRSLTFFDLSENPLVHIEARSFAHLGGLSKVFLGDLNFSPTEPVIKLNLTKIFGTSLSQLTQLYISSGMRPMQLTVGGFASLNQNLSLRLKGQTVTLEDCEKPFFESVVSLHADTEQLLCGSEFAGKFLRSLETLEYRSKLSAKHLDLTELNELVNLRKLILVEVDLSKQTLADTIFHNLTKLEELRLAECKINILEGSLTKDLKSLKTFFVRMKNTYNVLYSFTEPLSSLKYLVFEELETFCSCDNAWLIPWAKNQRQVEVLMNHYPFDETEWNIECLSDNGIDIQNFLKYSEANCRTDPGFVLFLTTGLGLTFFMLVVLLHNLAGSYLLPLYHITLGWLSEAMRTESRRRYVYDAFVSYSGKDERWVVEQLLPNLEQRGPPFLRLCLHSRDFQLGKDIVENITDSLYRSRHTLCLVSRHYLNSSWCSLEMRLATYRLQAEHRDVLILVFLEKIPPRRLSAHHRLARLVKTRTYLDCPQDPDQHQAFWDRLWTKLKPQNEE